MEITEKLIASLLFPFINHESISPRQLRNSISTQYPQENVDTIIEQLVAEGWIYFFPQHPKCVGKLQFLNDGYFTLSKKTKNALS